MTDQPEHDSPEPTSMERLNAALHSAVEDQLKRLNVPVHTVGDWAVCVEVRLPDDTDPLGRSFVVTVAPNITPCSTVLRLAMNTAANVKRHIEESGCGS